MFGECFRAEQRSSGLFDQAHRGSILVRFLFASSSDPKRAALYFLHPMKYRVLVSSVSELRDPSIPFPLKKCRVGQRQHMR